MGATRRNGQFLLGGFGFLQTLLGMWGYNGERNETTSLQSAAEKDALWDSGFRGPIGNRISHAEAALTWGTANADKPGGDSPPYVVAILLRLRRTNPSRPTGENTRRGVNRRKLSKPLRALPINMLN